MRKIYILEVLSFYMHLTITKKNYKGKVLKHAKIVQSYRDCGTSKQKTILNLGSVNSDEDLNRYREILDSMKEGNEFVNLNDIKAKNAKEFGVTHTVSKLFDKYGVSEVLTRGLSRNRAEFDVYQIIKALIINRLVEPSSDLAACDWISKHYPEELNAQEQYIYRALDYLASGKEEIELGLLKTLKKKIKLKTNSTYYDLTSSYFEGKCCEIAMFGYSRDHRTDRKQIVIGLAMCDGIPISHEVYEGNTADKSTLQSIQEKFKQRLSIRKTIFLADRGIMSADNIAMLEEKEQGYIIGCERRNDNIAKKLLVKQIRSDKQQYAMEVHREQVSVNGKEITRKYILCMDKNTKKERSETLLRIKTKVSKKLGELRAKYEKSQKRKKGKKLTRDSVMQKVLKILGKNKRLFDIKLESKLEFSINKEKWEYERKIAGKFLLVTNTDVTPDKAMKAYKQLQVVENAFDEIKNFIRVRPFGHRKERRIKAHVFVCVLSFLAECLIERLTKKTGRKSINELKTIKLVNLDINGIQKALNTELSPETEELFKKMRIPKPFALRLK